MPNPINTLAARRRKARHYALQALYQWTMNRNDLTEIEAEFRVDNDFSHVDGEYFHELLTGIVRTADSLDESLLPLLDRSISELDPVERNLLRLGAFELRDRIDVPYKVAINEAVALAKKFGATDSFRYVNGVLDKLAQDFRSIEIAAEH